MRDVEDYDDIFPKGGYPDGLVRDIEDNQHALGGRTFFERLLELLQIKWRRIYPPKDESKLRDLHKRITDAQITLHYKHCLIFYLLKDLSPSSHEDTELSSRFGQDVHLEKRFWTFIEGIWELDHLQFETAVSNLTHPSIIPTFPDEILLALLNRKNTLGGGDELDVLPLAYYNCAKPPLVSESLKIRFTKYMAARNVTETYYWIHSRSEIEHKPLLEALIEKTLDSRDWSTRTVRDGQSVEDRAMELVGLPFEEEEESWIEHFLTEGKGRTLRGAEETVLMRRIATGRLQGFAAEKGSKGRKLDGVNWEILKDGVKKGLGARADDEAYAA